MTKLNRGIVSKKYTSAQLALNTLLYKGFEGEVTTEQFGEQVGKELDALYLFVMEVEDFDDDLYYEGVKLFNYYKKLFSGETTE